MCKWVKITTSTNQMLVRDFVKTAKTNDVTFLVVADYKLSQELRVSQLRSGKIGNLEVLAAGADTLGNTIVLTKSGTVRSL